MEGNEVKTILVYDDEDKQTEQFGKKLNNALEKAGQDKEFLVKQLDDEDFQDSIKQLQDRQNKLRENKKYSDDKTEFDNASIFIIDYDLLYSQAGKLITGEIVTYIVRCFSSCKLIIGLNQYGRNPFDLTLKGHPESFADLNLGADQLSNPDLWRGDWGHLRRGYRPWSWPNLSDFLHNFDKKVNDVKEHLDTPIHKVIGFDLELLQLLPHAIVQFIGKDEKKEPDQVTFRDFVTKSENALRPKDADALNDGINDHILARIGAARISKWLERLIIPEQNILVDAPHLISRYPSLMRGDRKQIETWNRTANLVDYSKLGLKTNLIEPYRFEKDYWISRPVWFWNKLRECEAIKEIKEPWGTDTPNWVFCEDASRFYERKYCKEFLADTVSPFTRRFTKGFEKVDYRPKFRFAL